jgi:phage tail sheath gpL-like
MAIQFNEILRMNIPFVQAEIAKLLNASDAVSQKYTSLIIGQKTSAGSAETEKPIQIFTAAEAEANFGADSMLYAAVKGYYAINKSVELRVIALDDLVTGVSSTGTVTIVGTATKSGTFNLYINGKFYRTAVSVGDTAAIVATKIDAEINDDLNCLVNSSIADAVITLTATHKGSFGNTIKVMMNYNSDETTPVGLSTTIVAMNSGAGDPDLTDYVIPHLELTAYNLIVMPYIDNANLILVKDALTDNFKATERLDSFLLVGHEDTVTNLSAKVDAINSPFVTILDTKSAFITGLEFAARTIAYISDIAQSNQGGGYLGTEVFGVLALAQRPRTERNVLAGYGISTVTTLGTKIYNETTVTTYIRDNNGILNDDFSDLRVMLTLSYVRYAFIVRMSPYQGWKVANDADIAAIGAGAKVMTPSYYKELLSFIYQTLVSNAVCIDISLFEASLLTERDTINSNRINSQMSVTIIGELRQQAMQINFAV